MGEGNLYSALASRFLRRADALALRDVKGRSYSYAELDAETAKVAGFLHSLGMPRGARVAASVEKSPAALFLYLGAVRAGFVYLPMNPAYSAEELGFLLKDAEPACFVGKEVDARDTERACRSAGVRFRFALDDDGQGSFARACAGLPPRFETADVQAHSPAAILYTSGTTGRSKGAVLSHANLLSNAEALVRLWGFTSGDTLLHALPLYHVHGLFVAMHCALLSACRMVMLRKFEASAVLAEIPGATVFMGVPTYYARLLKEPSLSVEMCRHMRLFISGSAPLLPSTFQEFQSKTGHTLLERYGMTETGMIASNPYIGARKVGSVGPPLPGVSVRIADVDGKILAPGEVGEVQVSGANVFAGYFRMPERVKDDFTPDGYFKTGDLGTLDGDGYLSLVGRSKDLIISGGLNVYPKEVEQVLDELPGVAEAAVIGIPHPDLGEGVVAVLVMKPGAAALSEAELKDSVRHKLAGFKLPKRWLTVPSLPRNAMGKVQKSELRKQLAGLFGQPRNH